MKFTINAKTFATALQNQLRVIGGKSTVAILDTFKIRAWKGYQGSDFIQITASDPETTSILTLDVASLEETGELCIDAKKITDIVRKLGDKQMTFEAKDTEAKITCGKGVYTLPIHSVDEYPKKEIPTEGFFTLPTATMLEGFNATKSAVSTDIIRPQLCGVHMNIMEDNKGIDFVGTDTHQLVVCHVEAEGVEPRQLIIPAKTVMLAMGTFAKYPEIQIAQTDNSIVFKSEDATIMSVLVKGKYPNYNRVFPQTLPYSVKVNRKELLDVINRVSGFASNATNMLVLEDSGMMELKVSAKDFDSAQTAEDYVMSDGSMGDVRIGFNATYLTSVLGTFDGDEITLHFVDPSRPMLIHENNIKAIIMPIQVVE